MSPDHPICAPRGNKSTVCLQPLKKDFDHLTPYNKVVPNILREKGHKDERQNEKGIFRKC